MLNAGDGPLCRCFAFDPPLDTTAFGLEASGFGFGPTCSAAATVASLICLCASKITRDVIILNPTPAVLKISCHTPERSEVWNNYGAILRRNTWIREVNAQQSAHHLAPVISRMCLSHRHGLKAYMYVYCFS